ncbi:MAG TPA: hypothetical protein PKA75_11340 [Chitinophagales bacterium]|nr:hypothetical protein [Chitinophagales bacterium]
MNQAEKVLQELQQSIKIQQNKIHAENRLLESLENAMKEIEYLRQDSKIKEQTNTENYIPKL